MDRRTIIFVLCMAAAFFFFNIYFGGQKEAKQAEWAKQQEVLQAKQSQEDQAKMAEKLASPSELPLVALFSDSQGNSALGFAVQVGETIFTLPGKTSPAETIYFKQLASNASPAAANKITAGTQSGVVLYATNAGSKPSLPSLPTQGVIDLQLVEMTPPSPSLFLGEYKDGKFRVPFAAPKTQSFVFYKEGGSYLPIGTYNPDTKQFSLFKENPQLAPFLFFSTPPAATQNLANATEEKYYVLQNDYLQLVFSNYGGALAEINLPFESEKNSSSVVKEIGFDRTMLKDYPYNDYFPSKPYYTAGSNELASKQLGGYYPLLRRNLVLSDKGDTLPIPPRYYALNIVSDFPEVAELVYEVKEFDASHIVFETVQQLRRIRKTFSLVENQGDTAKAAPYVLNLSIDIEGDGRGLWLSSGVPEVELVSGNPSPALKYRITRKGKSEVEQIDPPKEKEVVTVSSLYPDWVSNSNGYLGIILDPVTEIGPGYRVQYVSGAAVPTRLVDIDREYQRFKAVEYPGYNMLMPLKSSGGTMQFRIYTGPYQDDILKAVDQTFSNQLTGYNPDYAASQSFHGWFAFISEPFAKFLFILMNFFHSVTGSWAFAIILLTVALRIMLYPLNAWSFKSMRRMQEIAPEVAAIQAKYKKDQKKAQVEIMNLYRAKKVNPFTGCFPILIQMPFLIGMFDLLKSTFELRGASFIPGWIDNLTAPDVLFSWSYPIFFIGTEFHLLPILLGAVMYLQQKMSSTAPKDPSQMTDQQKQQKMMGNIMVIVFAVMFYHFPSGLNIYWLSSMLLGILQQWFTNKQLAKAKEKTLVEQA